MEQFLFPLLLLSLMTPGAQHESSAMQKQLPFTLQPLGHPYPDARHIDDTDKDQER
jgi:hypothetical protein